MVGSAVGFGVEVSPLWGLWDNGGSKIGPHMVLIWLCEGDALFVPKPYYERVEVGLDIRILCSILGMSGSILRIRGSG